MQHHPVKCEGNSILNIAWKPSWDDRKCERLSFTPAKPQMRKERASESCLNAIKSMSSQYFMKLFSIFVFIAKVLENMMYSWCPYFLTIFSLLFFCNLLSSLTLLKGVLTIFNETQDKLLFLPNSTWNLYVFEFEISSSILECFSSLTLQFCMI